MLCPLGDLLRRRSNLTRPRCVEMNRAFGALFAATVVAGQALAGQVPGTAAAPDIPISSRDRVYAAEQFSNTISVVDPASNKLLGVIRLGDTQPANLSPL